MMKVSRWRERKVSAIGTVLAGVLLAGCGGSGSDSKDNSVSLTEISGPVATVYDGSFQIGGRVDNVFYVFNSNGVVTQYDFLGDSFDQGPNCYELTDYDMLDFGRGELRAVLDSNFFIDYDAFRISGGYRFVEAGISVNGRYEVISPRDASVEDYRFTSLRESDFRPICR